MKQFEQSELTKIVKAALEDAIFSYEKCGLEYNDDTLMQYKKLLQDINRDQLDVRFISRDY